MEQIRRGPASLNHVTPDTNSNGSNHSGGGDARDELLNAIRKGVSLKPIVQKDPPSPTSQTSDPLATALARALQERSRALNQTDESEDDDEDDDDEEWDE